METAEVVREVGVAAGRLGLPGDDPEVLKDGYNMLVRLRPAPVVARVARVTAVVRADVLGHFRRADEMSRFLAGRGVPVVEPYGPGPVRHAVERLRGRLAWPGRLGRGVRGRVDPVPGGGRSVLAGAARAVRRVLDAGAGPLPNPNTVVALIGAPTVPPFPACRDSCWSWRTNGPLPS